LRARASGASGSNETDAREEWDNAPIVSLAGPERSMTCQ